ncbi:MAG: hypothetical protein ISS72_09500, partial [Candidatus Brocadiae bacterium]|nr:hypothetical protein [Candidatus Brocadiia bacterium]
MMAASVRGDVPYAVAKKPWPQNLGNHRAVVRVETKADAVWAHLPWRRRDRQPGKKHILVVDAATGKEIANVARASIRREAGDLVFQPATVPGDYFVYTLPTVTHGRSFVRTVYPAPKATADAAWVKKHELSRDELTKGAVWARLPAATVVRFEARSAFHRFDPMEVIATADETKQLLAKHADSSYLFFPESRRHPICMTDDLPLCWVQRGPATTFKGTAHRGEFYAFQIGVWAARAALADVRVVFGDLRGEAGTLPAAAFRCINTGGVDWMGQPFTKRVDVPKGRVQALWCGVQIPKGAAPGKVAGTVTIQAKGAPAGTVSLELDVSPKVLEDGGDGELWRHARLRWLDSTLAVDDEVAAPYTPLAVRGGTVGCLGRRVAFGPVGLPQSVESLFPHSVDRTDAPPTAVLSRPMTFVVEGAGGVESFAASKTRTLKKAPATLIRETTSESAACRLVCWTKMESDGYINCRLSLTATRDTDVKDIRLEVPFRPEVAEFMIGMGKTGGRRPATWAWKWNQAKHQDSLWLGTVNAGLQMKLKGPNYAWPLVNVHYHHKPLDVPDAWHNGGKGGCGMALAKDGAAESVVVTAYSGPRALKKGQTLRFDVGFLVTPVKPLDLAGHWKNRYWHAHTPPEQAVQRGANVINIHHGNAINPYINYPFHRSRELAAYVARGHAAGAKVKIYYTLRELSNHITEIWALRSLNHEVFADGPGGGYSWLVEHLGSGYVPAWHHWFSDGDVDAALVTTGVSRLHNYYIEGLAWL